MFSNSAVSLLGNIILYSVSVVQSGDDTLQRLFTDPVLLKDVFMIGLAGALGQIFIYFTVSLFNGYVVAIITTTRKLFSVIISNFEFQHNFSPLQWTGAGIVMACTFFELLANKHSTPQPKDKTT
mmetsp:Transcript_14458/g.10422  ORF Transcript_14458/g.10422 Transcript_14458/m.10422 type:complete len:125 (+) Transcript_14458:673-1047(+)